jgi:hypothetical protein
LAASARHSAGRRPTPRGVTSWPSGDHGHAWANSNVPPSGPEPKRYEVVVLVAFDDVGTQPITLVGHTLDLVDDPKPGDRVTVDTEPHLIVRRS